MSDKRASMTAEEEYASVIEQVTAGLKKYLPDIGKPGGIDLLTLHVQVPKDGHFFPGGCYHVTKIEIVVRDSERAREQHGITPWR